MFDIKVQSITVKKFRIVCLVQFTGQKFSNSQIKEKLLDKFPSLAQHKCKNSSSESFVEVMEHTSLAHILEHLIIDFQIKKASENKDFTKTLLGTSSWLNKEEGIAQIEFSYFDDIVAIKSINEAYNLLKEIISEN